MSHKKKKKRTHDPLHPFFLFQVSFNLGATGTISTVYNSSAMEVTFNQQPDSFATLTATVKVNGVNDPAQPTAVATIVPAATVTPVTQNLAIGASDFDIYGWVLKGERENGGGGGGGLDMGRHRASAQPAPSSYRVVPRAHTSAARWRRAADADDIKAAGRGRRRRRRQVPPPFRRPRPPTPPFLSFFSTNFIPDPTKDTVSLTGGATATVTAATPTDLRVHIVTPASSPGPLDATVTTYDGPSSPTLFAFFTSPSANEVKSCMINDAHTAVNETTCVTALGSVPSPSGIALYGGYAYVASSGTGTVRSCVVSNGTYIGCTGTTVTAAAGASIVAISIDPSGGNLYAVDQPNNAITRCSLSSGSLTNCAVVASATTTSVGRVIVERCKRDAPHAATCARQRAPATAADPGQPVGWCVTFCSHLFFSLFSGSARRPRRHCRRPGVCVRGRHKLYNWAHHVQFGKHDGLHARQFDRHFNCDGRVHVRLSRSAGHQLGNLNLGHVRRSEWSPTAAGLVLVGPHQRLHRLLAGRPGRHPAPHARRRVYAVCGARHRQRRRVRGGARPAVQRHGLWVQPGGGGWLTQAH